MGLENDSSSNFKMLEPKPRRKFSITHSCRNISMGNIGPIGTMGANDAMGTLGTK